MKKVFYVAALIIALFASLPVKADVVVSSDAYSADRGIDFAAKQYTEIAAFTFNPGNKEGKLDRLTVKIGYAGGLEEVNIGLDGVIPAATEENPAHLLLGTKGKEFAKAKDDGTIVNNRASVVAQLDINGEAYDKNRDISDVTLFPESTGWTNERFDFVIIRGGEGITLRGFTLGTYDTSLNSKGNVRWNEIPTTTFDYYGADDSALYITGIDIDASAFYLDGDFIAAVSADGTRGEWSPFSIVFGRFTESSPTPEPATLLIVGLGLAGLALVRRKM